MKRLKPALMSVCMLAAMLLAVFMPAGAAMAAADYSFIRVLLSTPHSTADIDITVNGSYTIKEKPDYKVTNGKYTVKLSGATVQLVKDGVTTSIGTKCTWGMYSSIKIDIEWIRIPWWTSYMWSTACRWSNIFMV